MIPSTTGWSAAGTPVRSSATTAEPIPAMASNAAYNTM